MHERGHIRRALIIWAVGLLADQNARIARRGGGNR